VDEEDVARFEAAWLQSLHAADAPPLTVEACLDLKGGGGLEGLHLTLHPSLRLLHFGHAAVSLWAAHQTEVDVDLAHIDTSVPEAALLLRPGWTVHVLPVPAVAWPGLQALLGALQSGLSLGEAAGAALTADANFDLTAHLGQLLSAGAFSPAVPARPTKSTGD
jgi:hypothetical protein